MGVFFVCSGWYVVGLFVLFFFGDIAYRASRATIDAVQAMGVVLALIGLVLVLAETTFYDWSVIDNANAAMVNFEAGRIETVAEYERAMSAIGDYNEKVLEAETRAGNWWNGSLLEKFEGKTAIILPDEFFEGYVRARTHTP